MPLLTGTTSIIQALFRRQARALSRRPPDAIVCNTCNPVTVCRASTVASGLRATGSSNGDSTAPSYGGDPDPLAEATGKARSEEPPDEPKFPGRGPRTHRSTLRALRAILAGPVATQGFARFSTMRSHNALCRTVPCAEPSSQTQGVMKTPCARLCPLSVWGAVMPCNDSHLRSSGGCRKPISARGCTYRQFMRNTYPFPKGRRGNGG
jgi:hypothetical protein